MGQTIIEQLNTQKLKQYYNVYYYLLYVKVLCSIGTCSVVPAYIFTYSKYGLTCHNKYKYIYKKKLLGGICRP